ncbi:MAG: FtsW/RodA/SpoVE family cell cycle protein [Oscillatoriaceae cyanobacterium Prado104]|jgi:cell division protein FtsW|nr:FtsW/RodA/SpoVE family cell cycle protein [Oscillatoriaceae cyanobacterium Prado104]
MAADIRRLIPFFDPTVSQWAAEARWLRWLTFLWLFVGLTVLFSASYPSANAEYGDGLYYIKRQLVAVAIGLVGFNLVIHSNLRYLLKIAQWGVLALLGLLLLTLVPGVGTTINGATRWISLGPVPVIQPSELIKPFLVLQSARIFGNWPRLTNKVRLTWLGIFGTMLLGILLQPNLSTTALCGMTLWLVALAAGLPYLQLGATALGGILAAVLSISFRTYQRRRIMSFLNPWADPMQDGYQLIQSLLAVGSGGVWGVGLGMSQQKLFYLPIQYSDFIFAVFAEEFGLAGGLGLLLVLGTYATLALRVAVNARNVESQLVAIGVMVVMVGQSMLNIGVATGVLPTTGLPLPFFSYGGSSMLASLLLSGLLIRVAREGAEAEVVSLDGRRSGQLQVRSNSSNTQIE